ncbi:uncharacterized protein LOC114532758 [Dendronephthya gigantea]|uniref:uncharacterized protein LOC114532758 n=1 Tax=Dendronephthya gigantea TaxID=151771 RepID=UPI0010697526|nr:uncharacterized protein LOC114532758 [Dendronephthya gigantea]XP_028410141.1 uncharacterized protein LOC114532758 [Dendronephthya gigantea]XP_028410142.1 uncharacterized protein LOC114532758 [Dendronephthya gigantea]
MATIQRRNDINSCGENWSDYDSYSSGSDDDLVHDESSVPASATTAHNLRNETISLANNSKVLSDFSYRISGIWKQVGRNLHVKECIIENIENDYSCDGTRERAYQMLLWWSRSRGSDAREEDLLNAIALSESQKTDSERAMKLQKKSKMKLEKMALRTLQNAWHFYQGRVQEVERLQNADFQEQEAQEMQSKLQKMDKDIIQGKLDSLQLQISSLQEKKCSDTDQLFRVIADRLYEIDKTFKQFNDALELLDELRVSYYSQIECTFVGLCRFRHIRYPRFSSSVKHTEISMKQNEELEDDVFQEWSDQEQGELNESTPSSKMRRNTPSRSSLSSLFRYLTRDKSSQRRTHPHLGQEEHTKRKLGVSITDIDEQISMEEFLSRFCPRYRRDRPFIYSHCCMNPPRPLSSIDPSILPIPRYQSTEAIISLVTSPFRSHPSGGFVNVASYWI